MEKTDWACPSRRNSSRLRMLESGGGMSGMAECRYVCDVKMCKLEFMSYVTLLSFVVISHWDCSLELDCRSVNKWGYPCERR
eukprot:scaffold1222_cov150-Amphora_coffeaeformis.AAC.1